MDIFLFSFAVLLSSFISGVTGMGGGILLLAFMSPMFPPAVLIPLHGTIQLFSNVSRVALSAKRVDLSILLFFAAGAALGSLVAAPLTLQIPPLVSSMVLASAILFFTWWPKMQDFHEFRGQFFVVATAASFLSLFVGATGPLTAPFFINSRLDKDSFVPTKAACQIPIHLFKVLVFLFSGFVLSQWFKEILVAIPLVFLGSYLGKLAAGRFDENRYKMVVKILITLLVMRMVVKLFL